MRTLDMIVAIQRAEESEVEKEKDVASKRIFLCELPPEVQRHIASFLLCGDSIVFGRLISKALASNLVSPTISPRMISTQPCSHPKHPKIPFMVSLQEDNILKFHNPLFSGFYRTQIPELSYANIRFSNHGWLLMSTSHNIFFFEPFSKVKIELPMIDEDGSASFCFNSPPTSPECFVISLAKDGTYYSMIKRGEENWTERSLYSEFRRSSGSSVLMVNGLCYRLGGNRSLGMFDPNSDEPYWNNYGNFITLQNPIHRCFLVKLNQGELLRVLEVREDRKIEMSIFHIKRRIWSPLQSLENKMLFLGSGTCLLESNGLRGMHNKIYLPRLHNDANIFYSLSAKRYLSFHGNYLSKTCFDDVKRIYNSVWLQPVSPTNTICGEIFKW